MLRIATSRIISDLHRLSAEHFSVTSIPAVRSYDGNEFGWIALIPRVATGFWVGVMALAERQPKLLLPFLTSFYDRANPLSWLIIRTGFGIDLAVHGWEKVVRLPAIFTAIVAGTTASLSPQFDPAHNIILAFFEFGGGICIALGLFTRFFAAAAAIDLAIITFTVFWPHGYHAYEYVFWWGLAMFAIALRGGGPYSLDRRIGREL